VSGDEIWSGRHFRRRRVHLQHPNDPAFNGGTLYQDGVGGVYVKFQICNGTNEFILNLRGTKAVIKNVSRFGRKSS
jgi:hypothetical protein